MKRRQAREEQFKGKRTKNRIFSTSSRNRDARDLKVVDIDYEWQNVDLPSQNLAQNRQYRDTVTCLPAHTEQRCVKVAKVRIICTGSGSIVILLPPTHQQGSRNDRGHRMNQRCTIRTKLALRSEPHACAQQLCDK